MREEMLYIMLKKAKKARKIREAGGSARCPFCQLARLTMMREFWWLTRDEYFVSGAAAAFLANEHGLIHCDFCEFHSDASKCVKVGKQLLADLEKKYNKEHTK